VAEFRVTPRAFRDLNEIRIYLEKNAGDRVADRVESRIFAAFDMLVQLEAVGHRRRDMRQPELRFHRVYRYMIVFRREPGVVVLRVLHGARDIAHILKQI
jgi:plasmid stabilization system protein ParE